MRRKASGARGSTSAPQRTITTGSGLAASSSSTKGEISVPARRVSVAPTAIAP